jgi:tetratricopeptide (TPR) repeat protein
MLEDNGRETVTGKTYWQKLERVGWLDFLPIELHEEVRTQLEINLKNSKQPQMVCAALAQGGFEAGCTDGIRVIASIAQASSGAFQPTNITIQPTNSDSAFELSFMLSKKKYRCLISSDSEFLSHKDYDAILEAVNLSLNSTDVKQRFFVLPLVDVFNLLVFVPPSVYDAAVKAKLIPREVEYSREDAFYFNDLALYHAASSFDDSRDGKAAVQEATKAVSLDPENSDYMETLAAAYAEVGNFKKAIAWQERALRDSNKQTSEAKQGLVLYRNGRPYRLPP